MTDNIPTAYFLILYVIEYYQQLCIARQVTLHYQCQHNCEPAQHYPVWCLRGPLNPVALYREHETSSWEQQVSVSHGYMAGQHPTRQRSAPTVCPNTSPCTYCVCLSGASRAQPCPLQSSNAFLHYHYHYHHPGKPCPQTRGGGGGGGATGEGGGGKREARNKKIFS